MKEDVEWRVNITSEAGLDPRPVHVRSVLHKVQVEQVLLPVLRFCPVIITPSKLHTHLHINIIIRKGGRSLKSSSGDLNYAG